VLGSARLSPRTTPLAPHAGCFPARGDYAEDVHELAACGAGVPGRAETAHSPDFAALYCLALGTVFGMGGRSRTRRGPDVIRLPGIVFVGSAVRTFPFDSPQSGPYEAINADERSRKELS
jgi:hypothetical protein